MINYINRSYRPKKDEIVAEFYIEPNGISLEKAAAHVALESSIGTWTAVSTMSKRIANTLKPHVFEIKKNGEVKIAYPLDLFELGSIPQLLSSIAGNVFGMKILKKLRLQDISFPKKYVDSFKGPRHGINGIRKLTKIPKRPLCGTIVKPKLGLTAKEHAKVAYEAWTGGIDVVKDDENLTSMPFNHFKERIRETLKLRDKAEKETGEKKIYMPNVTAETIEMLDRADYVTQHGGEYIMVDIITVGWGALETLRNNTDRVIHAHRAEHAAFSRDPKHGISMNVIAKLSRLIGVDQLHIGTIFGKMQGGPLEVESLYREMEDYFIPQNGKAHVLEQKWYNIKPVLAVSSGGLHPGHTTKIVKALGKNVVLQYGGGCHGHPDGTKAGAIAIRQSVDATTKGIPLKTYAKTHPELKKALDLWTK
ncbi:MAG: type III ribulose-bisphosphate carboxylase [Candidatus Thorarchaeota archaeon]